MAVHPIGWYKENAVQLRTGHRVSNIDCMRHTVTLDTGEEIAFDKLLLATGATPRPLAVPGADLPNLFTLRTFEDAERLLHAVDKARVEGHRHERGNAGADAETPRRASGRGRAAVIGGGTLGVEVAASLAQNGLEVDLIVSGDWPWHKFAGETTGKFLIRYLEKHGVAVHTHRLVQRLEGDGRVQKVVLDDASSVTCDFAVAAVGILMNRELLRGTPIAAEKAILVDDHCCTNIKDIYAAGDCAAVFDPLFGKHRLIDHWDNARVTGAIAGANMASADVRYDIANNFFSDVFDLAMQGWGEARFIDHRITRGAPNIDAPDFIEIGIASDGRIAQVMALGGQPDNHLLSGLVKRRVQVDGKEELLKDPTNDLHELL
jgi:NADPH-dependent 2,4-dienoyl-CoA reductase/sulfur reductase-like enzyme